MLMVQYFHSLDSQFVEIKPVSSVPAAVASLKAHSGNQSDALCVNWDRGAGNLSGYLLTLYNPNGSQQARTQLGSEATEFVFSDLVPGRLYRAEVLSLSGELSNGASTLGRTGERTAFKMFITVQATGSVEVLQASQSLTFTSNPVEHEKRLLLLLSSTTRHLLPVPGCHQHLPGDHLERPR